jgi:hypothetical protein
MSKLIRNAFGCSLICIFLLSVAASTFSQRKIPVNQETILTFAHDLVQVFYPELLDNKHRLSLCVTTPGDASWLELGGVYFTVTPAEVYPLRKLISSHPQTTDHVVLGGSIWLPPMEYGRVQEMHAYSDAVHEQQVEDLRQLVESHPDWSNAQAVNALKQAGARFGPDDKEAFVNSLPLDKAERFLGKLKITLVEFNYPDRDRTGHFAAPALDWTVQAEAELPDGTHPRYGLRFEPFEGKLTSLVQSLGR